jgi:ubiquinone/menaquinone biosynthesis C-methylase UbiE
VDAKQLNAIVHDRESELYDDRFLISYDAGIGDRVVRDIRQLLPELPYARRALDVACGTGYLAIGLAAAGVAGEVHACDLSAKMLERCRDNAMRVGTKVDLALCDAERLPYADATFDLVCARGALHHVPSPLEALKEIRRVLAPAGTALILTEPTPSGERQVGAVVGVAWRGLEVARKVVRAKRDEEHHQWELASMAANLHTFEADQIENLAIKAGFEDITVSTAAWAWVLALGVNYFFAGEIPWLAANPLSRLVGRAGVEAAATFDRVIGDRVVPPRLRHTVQAVLR